MKIFSKIFAFILTTVLVIAVTGCGQNRNYDEYIGYQFSGTDPWQNELVITIRALENSKLTWTYTDVYENDITLYGELSTEFKNGTTSFNVKGYAGNNYTFDYKGILTLKDGKLTIKYEDGSLTSSSPEGGSVSHQISPLQESQKTIVLTKVVDKY